MDDEFNSLMKNQTWTYVTLPSDRKAIACKWVYKIKQNADGSNKMLFLHQASYIERTLEHYNLLEIKLQSVPSDPYSKLTKEMCPKDNQEIEEMTKIIYRQTIGSLMYLMNGIRPDIAYAVSRVSQFLNNPGPSHWTAVKKIFRCLKATKHIGICFGGSSRTTSLIGFYDADFAGNLDTRKSTTRYVFMLNNEPISWCSQKQNCVSLSTTESEYIAASEATKEAIWLRQHLRELHQEQHESRGARADLKIEQNFLVRFAFLILKWPFSKSRGICIKFCFKLKKSATETHELIKEVFGDAALSRSRNFEWFSRFLKGREKVNDDQHTGRPRSLRCEENKLKIKELIKFNRIISITDLSSETGLSVGINKRFRHDPNVFKICSRILTEEQKEVRMDVCKNMVEMTRTDPEWMQKIITGNETWVYQYDPETKRQSSQWIERGEPKPKKARFTKYKVKSLLVTFFYINGLVHHEFIPFGRTINQEVYLRIMRRLREAVRLKRPERWQNNEWYFTSIMRGRTQPMLFCSSWPNIQPYRSLIHPIPPTQPPMNFTSIQN
ncbi:hypothetical protein LAZ67_5002755 [Cordylochernes scorpioides]|uniref:Mos1 transposase HTH domain-containing protein n=1 Tax=Cordylochernes scorpioides TaxID=51811 RepID=A0ABY6KGN9_9ARAC|nr:hypothetical protein LAZ67_5002755 [Cordylochernes scorpioides]